MILDTNALSALTEEDPDLLEQIRLAPRIAVTLITLGEFAFGILRSRHQEELRAWLDAFLRRSTVLSPTTGTLPFYAAIRLELKTAGTPIPANDVWIAALVRQHAMPLVSRDQHFDHVAQIKRLTW